MATLTYAVRGLTCGRCIGNLIEEVWSVEGVTKATVDLVKYGESRLMVAAGPAVSTQRLRAAVRGAGFRVADEWSEGRKQAESSRRGGVR